MFLQLLISETLDDSFSRHISINFAELISVRLICTGCYYSYSRCEIERDIIFLEFFTTNTHAENYRGQE